VVRRVVRAPFFARRSIDRSIRSIARSIDPRSSVSDRTRLDLRVPPPPSLHRRRSNVPPSPPPPSDRRSIRCGHCKALAPTWDELGDSYAASNSVVVGDVDCTVEEDLCGDHEVRGYPTLKYFTPETGEKGESYEGGRDLDDLKAFVEEKLEVKCDPETAEDPESKCSEKERAYVAKMREKTKAERKTALKRLEKMKKKSMTKELKAWVMQRIVILAQM
jgi:protein disulfide-isomerase A6